MAYYRTLTSGERRLIYTARDRRIQRERRILRSPYPVPPIVTVDAPPGDWRTNRQWTRRDVEHFWWWHNYNPVAMQQAVDHQRQTIRNWQRRNLLTLKRERRRITNEEAWNGQALITLDGETVRTEASPGYLSEDRLSLAHVHHTYKQMVMALHLYHHQHLLRVLGGERFDPPYSRL